MTELEGSGGGAVGKLWRKHGGGFYALFAVGTFVYMEVESLVDSFTDASGMRDFLESEIIWAIVTFGLETLLNTFLAGVWPIMWISWMGLAQAASWAIASYVVWTVLLAVLLARRERDLKKELGL